MVRKGRERKEGQREGEPDGERGRRRRGERRGGKRGQRRVAETGLNSEPHLWGVEGNWGLSFPT